MTINFPEIHRQNGIAKRARTACRFKKVVRCLKSMRDLFVAHGHLGEKDVPSFLIETVKSGKVIIHDINGLGQLVGYRSVSAGSKNLIH